MITIDWIEFLRSADFGGLRLGMLGQEVRGLLGKEEDVSRSKHPLILLYGRLQVALDENRVVSFTTYFRDRRRQIWKEVRVKGWKVTPRTSIEDFQEALTKHRIIATVDPHWNHESAVGFRLESGVSACFRREGRNSSLEGIGLYDQRYLAGRAQERVSELEQIVAVVKKSLKKKN